MGTNTIGYTREYYRKERKKVLEFLGSKCSFCGSEEDLEIHHKIQTIKGVGRDSLNRLVDWKRNMNKLKILCHGCHEKYHQDFKNE